MRAFLIAFVCLSTLAMAQNVVVATPVVVERELMIHASTGVSGERFVTSPARLHGGVPAASTTLMLVFGLSGLCAVGGRNHDRRNRQPV